MRIKALIIWFLTSPSILALAQTSEEPKKFLNAQAIVQTDITFYESEGYTIFHQEFDYAFNEKGINKVKKKFSIPKKSLPADAAEFPNAKVFTTTDVKGETKTQSAYYLAQTSQGKLRVVGFSTCCERVISIEKEFYEAIVSNTLPKYIFISQQVDTIKFAGRSIDLGPACHWRGIRNLQCPDMGQMNWSEFSSLDRAKQMITAQKALNSSLRIGDVLEDSEIDVTFEGQQAKALKRKLKFKIPQLIMGGSNILIIYYVVAEVRGRYVACVLSHYTDDIGAQKLPPLLGEVMQLKE